MSTHQRMNSKILLTAFVAALALLFGADGADATTFVDFTISDAVFKTETFVLPLSPTPSGFITGIYFSIINVPVVDTNPSITVDTFFFLNVSDGGGLDDSIGPDLYFLTPGAPQLYTGPEAAPTFITGNYNIINGITGLTDTLSISQTPLPPTWLMLLSGFVGLGFFNFYSGRKRGRAALTAA